MRLIDIVKRYIMQNKKNSLLIIVSIIISTSLFLFMNIISEDARNLIIDQAKQNLGTKHAQYGLRNDKEIKYFEKNSSIDKLGKTMLLGFNEMGHGQTLQIVNDDKNVQEMENSYDLKEGNFPIKENEIAMDSWYTEQKEIENPIGKSIKLDYTGYDSSGKHILYKGEKEFKIVGILKCNPILKAQGTCLGVISEECAKKNILSKNKYNQVVFKFKKEKDIFKQVDKIAQENNLNKDDFMINKDLIVAMSDSMNLKMPYIIVNVILALATILLIYNIFYILLASRRKDFGILRSLGFIPSDVSKTMIIEVFIYTIISIPIGLILGGLIANLSREYVIGVIYDMNYANSIKSQSYMNLYMISALLSILTIIIAVYKPLRDCSKIDPMVCMRKSDERIKINKKSIIRKFMSKFFKDYGNIASKNIQRNKKRTNLAIASMVIIFFLMSTVYSKSTSNFLCDNGLKHWIPGDYLLHNIDYRSAEDNKMSYDKSTLQAIKNIDGVTKVNPSRAKILDIDIDIDKIDKKSSYWERCQNNIESKADSIEFREGKKAYREGFEVMGIEDDSILENSIIDGKCNLKDIDNKPYIYIDKYSSETLKIKVGDSIKANLNVSDIKTEKYKETISKDLIVAGIIDNIPLTSQGIGCAFGAVMSVNQMNKFTGLSTYERFDIWTSKFANQKNIESELNKIIENSEKGILIPYKSEAAGIEKSDNQKAMIMTLVVGVIVALSLFNCCNTIVTSINSRSREFALFRGIGISKDEVKKIVVLESYIYIIVGFIISIIPTLIVRYIIIKTFETIQLINLKFIIATIIILIVVSAIIIITTLKTLKNIQGDDFIEQIKTLE
ncbi:ABC transporter permease [Paraclostridium ghonii]|uniref:ABC-type antimicrobial peptide transport system permease subunit n=1 Tax=Paraclostridium ghonii TaxID=29358 RepID=A0ABU0N2R0_9FIRM|nr:ABC transporter permease [Paeniclostridium ghonii]MDQ0557442.1 ABC-type antimicrobial peptide transport system permease subunit [Paeniclostridium ghonii]